jgi:hypothetical protein
MAGYRYVGGMRFAGVLAPILIGAALTLAVQIVLQFYITPRVDTRRRREERFERNVLDLGELLTSELEDRAHQALLEQSLYRAIRQKAESGEVQTTRGMDEQARKAQQLTWDFMGFVRVRVYWLAERVMAFTPAADEVIKFQIAAMRYLMSARGVAGWSKDDERPEAEFEAAWAAEREARSKLTEQVKLLASLRHPPRARRGGRLMRRRQAARITDSLQQLPRPGA